MTGREPGRRYAAGVQRFIVSHANRDAHEMGGLNVTPFLPRVTESGASAGSRNQASSDLLFLDDGVLGRPPGSVEDLVRAGRPERLPVTAYPARPAVCSSLGSRHRAMGPG
jgi:hypothetical protein